jgi:hypothetical protein
MTMPTEFPCTLLGLVDEIVKLARQLPEDASDDPSRYGDTLQRYEAMHTDLDRRYRIAQRQANDAVGTERGGGMQHTLDLLNGYA